MKLIIFTALLFFNFSALNSTRLKWKNYEPSEISSQINTKRLIWTKELEILFQNAYNNLNVEQRTPVNILREMKKLDDSENKNLTDDLTREQVSSHLQKYRNKKDKEKGINKADINFLLN